MTEQEAARAHDAIHDYLVKNFLPMKPDAAIADDYGLIEHGVLDSLGVAEVIEFVQSEFGVSVADEDITEVNFGSLAGMVQYVSGQDGWGGMARH